MEPPAEFLHGGGLYAILPVFGSIYMDIRLDLL
jgi:hypothetical protein